KRAGTQDQRGSGYFYVPVKGDQTRLVSTAILPCVALEYGQIPCAAWTSSSATSRSRPGRLTLRRAVRKKAPSARFRSISASTATSAGSVIFLLAAASSIAPM